MSKATVKAGQTLLDIVIQYTGSEESLVALATLNNLGVTDQLSAGTILELPPVVEKRVVKVFRDGGYVPAADAPGGSISVTMPVIRYTVRSTPANVAVVQPGQTLLDIAIQYLGDESGLVSLAQVNNISVTTPLVAGTELKLPAVVNQIVSTYFKSGGYVPAADISDTQSLEGIDYWGIEVDFIVQ